MKFVDTLKEIALVKAAKSIKNRDQQSFKQVVTESSQSTFEGMLPLVTSAIIRSNKFKQSKYQGLMLLGITIVNNIICCSLISLIIGKTVSAIFGKVIGAFTSSILFQIMLALTSIVFIASYIFHKFIKKFDFTAKNTPGQNDFASNNETEALKKEEQMAKNKPLHCAISDLSKMHSVFLLFIPCIIGSTSSFIVKKCRNWLKYDENEFILASNSNYDLSTKLVNLVITSYEQKQEESLTA